MSLKKAVVVIPIYKDLSMLKPSEKASLAQVQKILNQYDICFIAPIKLRKTIIDSGFKAEFWPDSCFASVYSYSHLLLTEEFYRRFAAYDYMLLYQLDAFVFSDRLQEFCNLGYDYIGAPFPFFPIWRKYKIGNGGFSLRKISSCIAVISKKNEIYDKTGKKAEFEGAEDLFFGYCGYDKDIDFSVPDIETALKFSIETDVIKLHRKLCRGNMPFGCHAWSKSHFWKLWEPFIKEYIPKWDEVVANELVKLESSASGTFRRRALERYLAKRLCRKENKKVHDEIMEKVAPSSKCYMLWGSGKIGKEAFELLSMYQRNVKCVIDTNPDRSILKGIKVLCPEEALNDKRKCKIIVSVTKPEYVAEITRYLNSAGLSINDDYMLYGDVLDSIAMLYWDKSVSRWGR
ncbi:MAG: hypothetical protein E7198_02550 [Schwartzia succinivorans]|uniref:DUF5672 family protein n=1 Tax=Schwartzia succinivorans TaxID=55507 RepID=UPI0023579877|nr:DUF5672 family protein [Schwartzia succinivorans]MBE6096659.1 hypothetical protein [Schwartzia succinivorans]